MVKNDRGIPNLLRLTYSFHFTLQLRGIALSSFQKIGLAEASFIFPTTCSRDPWGDEWVCHLLYNGAYGTSHYPSFVYDYAIELF